MQTNDSGQRPRGELVAIAVADEAKQPMRQVDAVEAVAGVGLAGDRYAAGKGAYQKGKTRPEQQVTLIAEESLAAAQEQLMLPLAHLDTRRNLLVRGVPLNEFVGRAFWVGDVLLEGLERCEPCGYLRRLTQPNIEEALKGRGGLRAQVLQSGRLQPGAVVRLETSEERLERLGPAMERARRRRRT